VNSVKYINSESAKTDFLKDLSAVDGKIHKTLPSDLASSLGEKINQVSDSLTTLTTQGKAYASDILAQVKLGIHQYFLDHGGIIYKIAAINWLHYTILLFFICIATMVVISLLTKKPDEKQLKYTYAAASPAEKATVRASWNTWDVIHTIIIIGVVVAFYIYFW
jgi:hypothetical protein